ncbi:MAG TPA: hypothetical protein DCZ94_21045 [Lentisphaeria bacterium]|nr:MAG: hypothetical protein A2X48_23250 [Lentisphaerae bacterium GWF2_49_21]HBC89432.1 hypothetical protein [Lentisphaeria bacterium]
MKALSGRKIKFTKANLSHFSDAQMTAFYVFPHILNKLKLLETQIFSQWQTATDSKRSQIEREAALLGAFEFILLLAGELKEGWEAIQSCYYGNKLSKTLNTKLRKDAQYALKRLPSHFTKTSIALRLRNDFSYHHSPDKVLSTTKILEKDDPHTAYLFKDDNNYFDYATKLRIASVAESLELSDWRKVIEHLIFTVVKEVYQDMAIALNTILGELMKTVSCGQEVVDLPNVPSDVELSGHFFFYVSKS